VAELVFDVVIVDAEMPNQHGLDFTRTVRRQFDQPNFMAPIILVSGNTPTAKVIEARDAGANAVIKKPVAPSVLLARIEQLARSNRDFISSTNYVGPDRRFKNLPLSPELPERRAGAIALMASPERAMSQDDVNALFG
jgi:DNA-binding response OmpR family regulator